MNTSLDPRYQKASEGECLACGQTGSPCWCDMELSDLFAEHNFFIEQTGGGCTAFVAYESEGNDEDYIIIIQKDNPEAPTQLFEPIEVSHISGDDTLLQYETTPHAFLK